MRDATPEGPPAGARLARAREYLAIAESGDAKREAYKRAAEEIAAHKAETGQGVEAIARVLQHPLQRVRALLDWHANGYLAVTPWRYSGKDESAANAHARRVVRERPEVIADELRKDPKAAAKAAADLLADPEVQKDPQVWAAVDAAMERAAPRREDRPQRPDEEAEAEADAFRSFPDVRAKVMEWSRRFAGVRLGSATREALLLKVNSGHEALTQVEEVLRAGDMDAALTRMLGGE